MPQAEASLCPSITRWWWRSYGRRKASQLGPDRPVQPRLAGIDRETFKGTFEIVLWLKLKDINIRSIVKRSLPENNNSNDNLTGTISEDRSTFEELPAFSAVRNCVDYYLYWIKKMEALQKLSRFDTCIDWSTSRGWSLADHTPHPLKQSRRHPFDIFIRCTT